jgi:hypothetical protein
MTIVAWPKQSVRPFESLWLLVLRFLWLNRPTPKDFADFIGLKLYAVTHFSLLSGTMAKGNVDLHRLREVLQEIRSISPGDQSGVAPELDGRL